MKPYKELNVVLFYGGDDNTFRNEVKYYLIDESNLPIFGKKIKLNIVAENTASMDRSILSRVRAAINSSQKCISILSNDKRTKEHDCSLGSPNVLFEIGLWIGAKSTKDIILLKQEGVKKISNIEGVAHVKYINSLHDKDVVSKLIKFLVQEDEVKNNVYDISSSRKMTNEQEYVGKISERIKNMPSNPDVEYWSSLNQYISEIINNKKIKVKKEIHDQSIEFNSLIESYIFSRDNIKQSRLIFFQSKYLDFINKRDAV